MVSCFHDLAMSICSDDVMFVISYPAVELQCEKAYFGTKMNWNIALPTHAISGPMN